MERSDENMILIGNGTVITQDDECPLIINGCICINNNMIEDLGTTKDMKVKYPDAEFVDVDGKIIMPGLINCHTHIYSSFARGLNLGGPPNKNFVEILENQWWRMDKSLTLDDSKYSAYATGLESVRYGVTTIFDHHAAPHHITGSLSAIAGATKDIGMRASLCYEVSDRDGEKIADEGIAENIRFIDEAAADKSDMLHGLFGLHAPFTLSDKTLEKSTKAMGTRGNGYHVHVAEGIADVYDSLEKYNKRCIPRLFDAGILGDKTIAVHCVHTDNSEIDMLAATNTAVVHNAESNMGNAVGTSPILKMIEKGVLVGMGTDAYTQDMFESLKVAKILQNHSLGDPSVMFMEAYNMLFRNNRKIAARYFEKPLGILQKDAYADVIVVDYTPHTPLTKDNIAGHTLFGMMGASVVSTMINGQFVMKDRQMITVDEQDILAKCREQAADYWKRV